MIAARRAIYNDRLGDPSLGDYGTPEQFVPVGVPEHAWETCMTINETWAYTPRDRAYKSSGGLVATLAEVATQRAASRNRGQRG